MTVDQLLTTAVGNANTLAVSPPPCGPVNPGILSKEGIDFFGLSLVWFLLLLLSLFLR